MTRVERHTAVAHVHGLALTADAWCVVVTCHADGCPAQHAAEGADERHATESAAALGWTWDGGDVDGCPAHPVGREE